MILRSLTKHVKDQNWFAVGLDFLIVVVGVFIGIQVANWNDDQAAKRRGDDYVERLLTDLRIDLKTGNNLIDYFTEVIESTDRAIHLMNDPESDPRMLVINAYRATEYIYTPRTTATWDEIVSAGEIGLLPRVAVSNGLSAYFSSHDLRRESLQFLRQASYRKKVRGLIPHIMQKAIRKGCSDIGAGASFDDLVRFRAECTLDTTDALVEDAALKLREDKTLLNELQFHASNVGAISGNIVVQAARIERLIELLENSQNEEQQ